MIERGGYVRECGVMHRGMVSEVRTAVMLEQGLKPLCHLLHELCCVRITVFKTTEEPLQNAYHFEIALFHLSSASAAYHNK